MPSFRDWLSRVLTDGESVQEEPPALAAGEREGVIALLREAFAEHALDVAGPPVGFDPDAAFGAAMALAAACWVLVSAAEDAPVKLDLKADPAAPPAHLSADVCLRFLPAVHRRARVRGSAGHLAAELDRLLRRWPLSGVLADLDGGPSTATDFGGHAGLQLLYAERLVERPRAGWVPPDGPAREHAEQVFHERGKPLPVEVRPPG